MTPLHYAAACDSREALDFLIVSGGKITDLDNDRRDVLQWAIWCKQREIVQQMVRDGYKPRQ